MATNPNTPLLEPRKKTGNYKPPENNFWRDLSQPWNYWRPTLSPPVYGYSYPFEAAGAYDFNIPLGYNTPPTYTPDLPATNIGEPTFYLGNATPPASTTGTLPPVMPTFPTYGPPLPTAPEDYAKNLTTGNPPAGGTYSDWQEWNRQMSETDPNHSYYNPYNSQYAWQWNPDAPGTLIAGADPRSQEGVPWHEELGIPWSSSYAPEYYKNLTPSSLKWLAIGANGSMGSRGWRMPKRYMYPEQQTRMQKRNENPPGNNRNVSIPAWVGPLVSWRT